jgi:hypothetical protein
MLGESEAEARVSGWIATLVGASRRHAAWVAAAWALATCAAGAFAIGHLGVNADLETLISPDVPYMKLRNEFDRALPMVDDVLLLVVDADTPERAADAADAIAARLEREPETFRSVLVPGGGPFFGRNGLLYLDLDELEELSENLARAQPYLAEISRDPSLRGVLHLVERTVRAVREERVTDVEPEELIEEMSGVLEAVLQGRRAGVGFGELVVGESALADEARRVVIFTPVLDYSNLQPARRAVERVRSAIAELGYDEGPVRVRLTGDFALSFEEIGVVKRQASSAFAGSFVLTALLLVAALRSGWLIGATLASLVVGLVTSIGFAAATVGHLNPISVAFGALFVGLAVDYGIHFCLRYQELRAGGEAHAEALDGTARTSGTSLLLCAGTTSIGFYAFMPTDFRGVAELGAIAGTGMLIGLLVSLTFLPAAITLAPARVKRRFAGAPRGFRIGEIAAPGTHPVAVLLATVAVAAVALALVPRAQFDLNPLRVRDPGTESVQAFRDLLASSTTTPWTVSVLAPDLASAEAVKRSLATLPVVERTVTASDLVPADQEIKLERIAEIALFLGPPPADPGAARPDGAATLAGIDALRAEIEAWLATGPEGALADGGRRLRDAVEGVRARLAAPETREPELRALEADVVDPIVWRLRRLHRALEAEPFSLADLPQSLRDGLFAVDGRVRVEVFPAEDLSDNRALARFVDTVSAANPSAVGTAGNILNSARVIVASFQQALGYATVVIAVILLLLWRRLDDVFVVLLVLALAGVVTTGVSVAAGIPFNFANVIVVPLLLGIGVDSNIHLVHRFRTEVSVSGGLMRTSTARAVFFSALTTIASFVSLGFVPHRGLASLGQLLTVGLLCNMVCSLVVLPAILRRRPARTR